MYDRILVPTDGSAATRQVLEHAIPIARANGATIHVLYVVDRRLSFLGSDQTREEIMDSARADGERAIQRVRTQLDEAGLPYETEIRQAVPHRGILSYANAQQIDLIVMGTHGETGTERIGHLGSVTRRVLGGGDTPVLVVNIGD